MTEVAHLSLFGGHLEVRETEYRIQTTFIWPGPFEDVTSFCQLCDVCQKTVPKRSVPQSVGKHLFIDQLFEKVAIDPMGPIAPAVSKEHKSILTLADYATRNPEPVPLKNIDTEAVIEALLNKGHVLPGRSFRGGIE